MNIKDKVALITGGTKGIGLGIAEKIVKSGGKVVITGRSQETAREIADHLNQSHPDSTIGMAADVRKYEDQKAAVRAAIKTFGSLDIAIANAGVGHFASIEEITPAQWNDVIDVNLTGAFYTIKAAVSALKASQGYYITISSLAGTNFFAKGSAYNASKFGLVGFTQAVMLDLRKYGIKTTTIMPGSVSTYFNNHIPSPEDEWKIQPEDIGQVVIDLLQMPSRTLPSKIEIRPSMPGGK